MSPLEGIPEYLKIPQDERKAAWEKFRADRKALPPEAPPAIRRITDLPGAKHHDDPDA